MSGRTVVPPVLEGFTWVRQLGAGGFADVHLYRQHVPDREVAVKVLRVADDGEGAAALAREGNALAAVVGHPSVITLHEVGRAPDGRPYLVLEFCPVSDLPAQVRRQPMAVAQALETMVQMCSAAETLHRQGLVHRDIKPGNIMITRWSHPVLADFGATLPIGTNLGEGGEFSPLWAPPEQQVVGGGVHPTLDVYALAATAWTLLTGHSPFEEPSGDNGRGAVAARLHSGRLPGLGRHDAPPALERVLAEALALDPRERTQSALALAEALREVQIQMRLAPTSLVVRDRPVDSHPELVDADRTLTRPIAAIDPDVRPGVGRGDDPEATLPASGMGGLVRGVPSVDAPRGVRPWVVALLVTVAVLLTVGGVSAVLLGGGLTVKPVAPTSAPKPQDPIVAPPNPTSDVTGELRDGRVYWTWKPTEQKGVHYAVTIQRPGRELVTLEVALTSVDVEAVAGSNCATVVAVGIDGRESSPAEGCIDIP